MIDHTIVRVDGDALRITEVLEDGSTKPSDIDGSHIVASYDYRRQGEMRTRWLVETASRWIVLASSDDGRTSGAYVSTPKDRPHHVPTAFAQQAREIGARVTWFPPSKAAAEAADIVPPAISASSVALGGGGR